MAKPEHGKTYSATVSSGKCEELGDGTHHQTDVYRITVSEQGKPDHTMVMTLESKHASNAYALRSIQDFVAFIRGRE